MKQRVYTILDQRVKLVHDNPDLFKPSYCSGCVFLDLKEGCEIRDEHELMAGVPKSCYDGPHHYEAAE